jgi:hypothetical protein
MAMSVLRWDERCPIGKVMKQGSCASGSPLVMAGCMDGISFGPQPSAIIISRTRIASAVMPVSYGWPSRLFFGRK